MKLTPREKLLAESCAACQAASLDIFYNYDKFALSTVGTDTDGAAVRIERDVVEQGIQVIDTHRTARGALIFDGSFKEFLHWNFTG